jgi:hypothetical protein
MPFEIADGVIDGRSEESEFPRDDLPTPRMISASTVCHVFR